MSHRLVSKAALVAGVLVATLPSAWSQARFDFDKTPGNLPKTVVPSRYALTLNLDPALDTFQGHEEITLRVRAATKSVVLHAKELVASKVELVQGGVVRELRSSAGPFSQSWSLDPTDGAPIGPGAYTLRIDYTGKVNAQAYGIFHANYKLDGKPARMLSTQLEATDARGVFPSFDEPSFRAVFDITLRTPKEMEVAANMPEASSRAEGESVVHHFKPTPPMPSYLVAFVVGHFDVSSGQADGIPIRVLTAPGKREQGSYALKVNELVVPYYNQYFGIKYALPKLDVIAVPSTMQGAMENWGLITYTETALLYDPAKSNPRTQRAVFGVVAHETAHQWFGNLVTAASWEEIWLNEAFATWMANKATLKFNPEWHTDLDGRAAIDGVMASDVGSATRAIRSGPVSEAAVFDAFDGITYVKGGAVLSMVEQWLGPDVFRAGLGSYMRERKFSNATGADLWYHMSKASKRDVLALTKSWTDQPGYPLVSVVATCDNGTTHVDVSQRRMTDGVSDAPAKEALAPTWRVPMQLSRDADRSTVLLTSATQRFDLKGCSAAPVVANAGGIGYYRVAYDAAGSEALMKAFVTLDPRDQVTLLSDTFALAQAGQIPMARWLALVAQVPKVDGPARSTLMDFAANGFAFLDTAFADASVPSPSPMQKSIRASARAVFAPELARVGWVDRPGDDSQTLKQRGALIERLSRFDDQPTIDQALKLFDADQAGTAPLPGSIRASVLMSAGMHGGPQRFDQLLARLKSANGEEERVTDAVALAGTPDEHRVRMLLDGSLTNISTPNINMMLPMFISERSARGSMVYDYLVQHWDEYLKLSSGGFGGRYRMLPAASSHFNETQRADRLLADQQRFNGADGALPAGRAASRIRLLAAVRQREAGPLGDALSH